MSKLAGYVNAERAAAASAQLVMLAGMKSAAAILAVTAACACAAELSVTVRTGGNPIAESRVTLYQAGQVKTGPVALGTATADASGTARITYTAPPSSVLYVFAEGATTPAVRLAAVVGAAAVAPQSVVVNEPTTVAMAYAMTQFLKAGAITGPLASLQAAAATAGQLVNAVTGEVSPFFGQNTLALLHTMSNLLASCVQSKEPDSCRDLFAESKAPGFGMPANTLDAAVSMARSPAHNVVPLYLLAPRNKPYSPALTGSPETWVLVLRHSLKAAVAPSYNSTIDPSGNSWVTDAQNNSVAQFDASGKQLSPEGGYRDRRIRRPQGVRADACGNIWIANAGGTSVTKFPRGDPSRAATFEVDMREPFGVAVDGAGYVWITGSANDRVAKLAPDGKPAPGSPFIVRGLDRPLEVAIDLAGNAWVANHSGRGVTMFRPDGQETRNFTGGGMEGPWGIAVDGHGKIFVANNKRPALSVLCGARTENCPLGMQTGDAISPATGYASNGVTKLTSVAIDAAGNVWVAGAEGVAEYVGLAAPVASPLIGPPRQVGQGLPGCAER